MMSWRAWFDVVARLVSKQVKHILDLNFNAAIQLVNAKRNPKPETLRYLSSVRYLQVFRTCIF